MSAMYGLMAELASAEALIAGARKAREAGYTRVEAYAPFPVEGLADAVGFTRSRLPLGVLLGGVAGGLGSYFMQWYSAVQLYPENVGGRPLHSWPAFIPIGFEMTILFAALAAVVGMLLANGLPRLRHPVFDVPDFDLATRNRFFLCLTASDPNFEAERARRFLEELEPLRVVEVRA